MLDQGLRMAPASPELLRTRVVQRLRTGYLLLEQKKASEAIRQADLGMWHRLQAPDAVSDRGFKRGNKACKRQDPWKYM